MESKNKTKLNQFCGMVGKSLPMLNVFQLIRQYAASNITVLIQGESGTGKELVAQAIHQQGRRSSKPFVAVNCGALPDNLVESEFFGHEKGSFSGAVSQRPGRFESANHGTLFLDEIGELPPHIQVKLLRVLQNQEFERVGGAQKIKTDVRIIAATNKNLAAEVLAGRFREDLYYRINILPVNVPPLRERTDDIPLLIDHFMSKYCGQIGMQPFRIPWQEIEALKDQPFPGNVRELENMIARMVVLAGGVGGKVDITPEIAAACGLRTAACGLNPPIQSRKLLNALKQIEIPNSSSPKKWHQTLQCTNIEKLHSFLVDYGVQEFTRADFAQFLNEQAINGKNKYKTAGEYLKILKECNICLHNGQPSNKSRYKIAEIFVES